MKKIFTAFLTFAMALCFPISLLADDALPELISQQEMPAYLSVVGEVLEINDNDGVTFLNLKPDNEDMGIVVLKVFDSTSVADAHTGLPQNVQDIAEGSKIKGYYSPIMTRSLPPQTNAFCLLINFENGKTPYDYIQVKEINQKESGDITVLTGDNASLITIMKENPYRSFKTKDIPSIDDITTGTELLVYYEIMALSYPGQATSQDTIFIQTPKNSNNSTIVFSLENNRVFLNDNEFLLQDTERIVLKESGDVLIPIRAIMEALGFTVTWHDADHSVDVKQGDVETSFKIGLNEYKNQKTKSILPKAELINDKTFVPIQLLSEVLDIDFTIK
ncbi:MAG: copper amine oxidase N-terminal domain-containing protein [Firmicutes bacterium]|nr:copper amine oxidase N-terminal domain-containing protein [Bacillota bacterium]